MLEVVDLPHREGVDIDHAHRLVFEHRECRSVAGKRGDRPVVDLGDRRMPVERKKEGGSPPVRPTGVTQGVQVPQLHMKRGAHGKPFSARGKRGGYVGHGFRSSLTGHEGLSRARVEYLQSAVSQSEGKEHAVVRERDAYHPTGRPVAEDLASGFDLADNELELLVRCRDSPAVGRERDRMGCKGEPLVRGFRVAESGDRSLGGHVPESQGPASDGDGEKAAVR